MITINIMVAAGTMGGDGLKMIIGKGNGDTDLPILDDELL